MAYLKDYRPPDFHIDHVRLDVDLDPERTRVRSRLTMRRRDGADGPLRLDGDELELVSARLDGRTLEPDDYVLDDEGFTLKAAPPDAFEIELETRVNPTANTKLQGLYLSGGRFCTQCESEGFRRITYFLDRPDVLSRYEVRVTADRASCPTLLSNGDLIEAGALEGGRHFTVWRDPYPKPSYLFALVGGAFETIEDEFVTMSGKPVKLAFHVEPGDGPRALFALDALKRAMAWDEQAFGREYDLTQFHVVAVRDFNYGAMENKSLNVFNASALLADSATQTDADFAYVERVVAHEYFHNWTGDRITLRDWFQLCLKEGLTVYRDQEFTADQNSRPVQRITDVQNLRAVQFPEDAGPLAHPVRPASFERIENFYTPTVYRKGAEVVRVLSALLGKDGFKAGMDRYFDKHDGQAVTVEDFVACFEETSGRDLSAFFGWYVQPGTPHVAVEHAYDPEGRRLTLKLSQSIRKVADEPKPVPVPLRIGFIAEDDGRELDARLAGETEARREHNLVLEGAAQEWVFEDVDAPPVPATMRGFMAPVVLEDDLTDDQRLVQMTHDPDSFTRWDAGQSLITGVVLAHAEGRRQSGPDAARVIDALERELDRAEDDPAFAALALAVPGLGELMLACEQADPEALFTASRAFKRQIAERLEPKLLAAFDDPRGADASRSSEARGWRSLRNAAMRLLGALGAKHAAALLDAAESAETMTGRLGAIRALSASGAPELDAALAAFETRWRDQPLVMDKWFAVQAAAPLGDAPARIARLTAHELFTMKNPNRARSVYGVFGNANLRAFHAVDGSGYEIMAKAILEADAINPLLAGRFVRAFEIWPRLEPVRREKAAGVLRSLAASKQLSKIQKELVEKLLAA